MKVLIIEDDKILSKTIKQCIESKFKVDQAFDGNVGISFAIEGIYDIIILDLMLPEKNGYEVIKELRAKKIFTPILVLTAKDELRDKIKGLNLGADDYLTKPFNKDELIARLEAIIRRTTGEYSKDNIIYKDLVMDLQNRKVKINDELLNLQGKQFDVLEYMINYKNTIITKDKIFDKIWGFNSDTTTNVVEVYASGLRKELKKYGYDKYFKTVRGVGYIWSE